MPASESRYRWYVLAVCATVYMVQHIDRQVVTLLLEPIGKEFALSDSQRGLLAGFAFAIPFAIAGLPIGLLIDRSHRVRLLSILLAVWSSATALCSLAGTYWQLVLARIGIGAAESGGTPTNMSLIADYFAPRQRTTAIGIYNVGVHMGGIVGFSVAGAIALAYGWRAAFLIAGIPGLLLALVLYLTVREPQRGASETRADHAGAKAASVDTNPTTPARRATLRELWVALKARPVAMHIMIAMSLLSMVTAGLAAWLPSLLVRVHMLDVRQAGLLYAFAIAPCAIVGSLLGGWLYDRLAARGFGVNSWLLPALTFGMMLAVIVGIRAESLTVLVIGFGLQHVLIGAVQAPSYSIPVTQMPAQLRGRTIALVQVASNILGYGVGVQLVGLLSDGFKSYGVVQTLPLAMLVVAVLKLWSVGHYAAATRAARAAAR